MVDLWLFIGLGASIGGVIALGVALSALTSEVYAQARTISRLMEAVLPLEDR